MMAVAIIVVIVPLDGEIIINTTGLPMVNIATIFRDTLDRFVG